MSSAETGHAAFDAQVGIRGDMVPDLADDREAKGRFLRAAVAQSEAALAAVEDLPDRLAAKARLVTAQWAEKVEEAHRTYEAAAAERDHWSDELDAFEGN